MIRPQSSRDMPRLYHSSISSRLDRRLRAIDAKSWGGITTSLGPTSDSRDACLVADDGLGRRSLAKRDGTVGPGEIVVEEPDATGPFALDEEERVALVEGT
jgi:hypothetical protein